jgi:hypothetical protein
MDADVKQPTAAPAVQPPPAFKIEGDRKELFGALAKARAEFKSLEANQTADIEGKDGRRGYKFDYADLATLQEATTPALSKHGLCISQPWWSEGDGYVLLTILMHESGAFMSSETWFSRPPDWQKLGSALSYQQRYQWRSFLGISASKDDDDANGASGNGGANYPTPARRQASVPSPAASPRPAPAAAKAGPRPQGSITDAQLNDISEVAREMGWNRDRGEAFMKDAIGYVAELEALPKEDAQKLIAAMVAAQGQRGAA